MKKSDVYHVPRFSWKQKFGIFFAIIFFIGAGSFVLFFKYKVAQESKEISEGRPVQEKGISFEKRNYKLVYALTDTYSNKSKLFSLKMSGEKTDIDDSTFSEDIKFMKTKKYSKQANLNTVSDDATMFVEVLQGENGDVLWLNKLWESGKEKLYEFGPGIHPLLIGFSSNEKEIYFDILDVTGLSAGQLNIFNIEKKKIVEAVSLSNGFERLTTPVLSPDARNFAGTAWKKDGSFAQAKFSSALLVHELKIGKTVTVQKGENYVFNNIIWSPNSTMFAYAQFQPRGGKEYDFGIWTYDIKTKIFKQINTIGKPVYWTPEGRYLVFIVSKDKTKDIFIHDFLTNENKLIDENVNQEILYWGIAE